MYFCVSLGVDFKFWSLYRNWVFFCLQHFEQDDPELYLRKVKYILDNDVDDMELTFSEEEYSEDGKVMKVWPS